MCGRSVFHDTFRAKELLNVTHVGPDVLVAKRDARPGDSILGVLDHGRRRYLWNFWWGFYDDGSRYNARIENVNSVALWATPWEQRQRCIIPVDTFYEGPRASPVEFAQEGGGMLAVAGLWIASDTGNRATMLTRPAVPFLKGHTGNERMPVILPREMWEPWLRGDQLSPSLLVDYEPGLSLAA